MKVIGIYFLSIVLLISCSDDDKLQAEEFPSELSATLQHQNNQRVYKMHIPPSYDGTNEVPLVIVLHGGGGNADIVQGFTQMNPVADANGFIVAYPQGFAPASQDGFSWADGRQTGATIMEIDDVGFIAKVIDEIKSDFEIRSDRIYVTGFSNGGFMSQKLACDLDNQFAAVATLGASIGAKVLNQCETSQSIPMLFMLGDEDPFIPYDGGTVLNNPSEIAGIETLVYFWKNKNACQTEVLAVQLPDIVSSDNSTVTLFEFVDCDCNAKVKFYKINNGGHTWPGVENESYEVIAGETNEDINASSVIWNFFDEHQLCL